MTVVKQEPDREDADDDGDMPGADDGYVPSRRRLDREHFKRTRARRATGIAALSTLVTGVVLYLVVVNAPGWPRTKETFFSAEYAREAFPKVLEGLWLNVRLLLICGVAVLVLGMLIAVARTLRGPVFFPLRALAAAYTDFFRGLPLIINLMIVVLGVPALRLQGVTVDPVLLGGTALTLTYSAYVAEVFRAGIESVHPRSARRPARWASPTGRHCGTSCSPRRYAARCRPSSTTSCHCRKTPAWSRSAARSTPYAPRTSSRAAASTTRRTSSPDWSSSP